METKELVDSLVNKFDNDSEYRYGWIANISMSYIDNERWYKEKHKKKYLNKSDKHTIANLSAEYFINLLSKK